MNPRDFELTQKPTPPPGPSPTVATRDLALLIVIGAVAILAMALLVGESWGAYYALRLWLPLWCIAALVHGGALLEDRRPWVVRVTRLGRNKLFHWGGGAYAAIALCCFGWLEWARLMEFVAAVLALTDTWAVRDFIRGLFDFGIDSVMNTVYAVAWPGFWRKTFSAGQTWPAVAVGWGVYESARWAVERIARTVASERSRS
jgi:hypothetical protein